MRIGQTSFAVFASKLVGSALGFVATLYFARTLGAEVLGQYALVLAVVAWLSLAGDLGVSQATTKRMSEDEEPSAYATAGAITIAGFGLALGGLTLLFGDGVNAYVGESIASLVVVLLLSGLFTSVTSAALNGERKVHLAGLLTPVGIAARSVVQIALVALGLELVGMLVGYAVGGLLVGVSGLLLVSVTVVRPRREHFVELYEYAKFSWLGGLQSRSFNDVDVLLLGVFLQSSLVGVYSAAWSIAKFLTLFDSAVSSTLFPELSRADAEGRGQSVAGLVEDSLTYGGLILIPGLFGGILLGERLLRIYGPEFVTGASVLWILIAATLLYGYQKQLLNALNGIDRPKAAFRINAAFIAINVVLNVVLIATVGLVGAAVATALSAGVGVMLALYTLRSEIAFAIPTGEIARQFAAAAAMAGVVVGGETVVRTVIGLNHNFATVVLLVAVGAATYFAVLFGISETFRSTVFDNSPL
ncbi:polysaccharide biosynthesis C-terminal domain-containing protein [Halobellus rarus]|uniref:Polysaccharide biosynthesis C-terminal domain-containing protein n=1 Tax=Halobellus rarus TaxID=1126237 RepID=A0ABD6CKW6_9EURY|nr:polysaccharide biosynthesis C-terminal domain-containing protein [Halobellus rarus]